MNLHEKENIIQCVKTFKHFLDKSIHNDVEEISDFFHNVPVFITNFIKTVEIFYNNNELSKEQQFKIVVYLMQYCSCYQLFKRDYSYHTIKREAISEVKRCICKQLTLLLDNTMSVLDTDTNINVGSFLNLMDMALDKIVEIDVNKKDVLIHDELNTLSSIIEEILCLSMSVAQVGFDDDNKIITASCRLVLNAVESLKTESTQEKPNIAMCNLAMDTCTDTLCAFEARVNIAVLRLCLKVFSEYKTPLINLYDFCEKLDKPDKNSFEPLISMFDLHMDRIFQIGLFSIASSTMGKRVAEIQNAMSNLEFLEGELVPAFVAMSKDSSACKKIFANILKKSWCVQVKLLQKAVHSVIEPSAYCKLIYEELKQKAEEIWQEISHGNNVDMCVVDQFLSYTKELGRMFKVCMESFKTDMKDSVQKQLETVYKVHNELAAIRNLLKENSAESAELNKRIFKRCQVLILSIKRLWLSTVEETQENLIPPTIEDKGDDIKGHKVAESDTFLVNNVKQEDFVLQNIIIKSKKNLKDRSICHLNQSNATFSQTLKTNTTKRLNDKKLNRLSRYSNLRNCSYRQSIKCMEGFGNISIAKYVHPRIQSLRSEIVQ